MVRRRTATLAVTVAAVAAANLLVGPGDASAQVYVAGSSVAFAPHYDTSIQAWVYHCSFAGWAHVQVNWTCSIEIAGGPTEGSHRGSFSNGSTITSTWSYKKSPSTGLCTTASAGYADGSSSDFDRACG